MNSMPALLMIGASIALTSAPARAQRGHGSMPHASMQHGSEPSSAAHAIAEGTVKNGIRTGVVSVP